MNKVKQMLEALEKELRNEKQYSAADKLLPIIEEAKKDGWIPCSEGLPPKPGENPLFEDAKVELYLVSEGAEFYPFRAFWNGKDFTDGFSKLDVEVWMPLPEPYKGE